MEAETAAASASFERTTKICCIHTLLIFAQDSRASRMPLLFRSTQPKCPGVAGHIASLLFFMRQSTELLLETSQLLFAICKCPALAVALQQLAAYSSGAPKMWPLS